MTTPEQQQKAETLVRDCATSIERAEPSGRLLVTAFFETLTRRIAAALVEAHKMDQLSERVFAEWQERLWKATRKVKGSPDLGMETVLQIAERQLNEYHALVEADTEHRRQLNKSEQIRAELFRLASRYKEQISALKAALVEASPSSSQLLTLLKSPSMRSTPEVKKGWYGGWNGAVEYLIQVLEKEGVVETGGAQEPIPMVLLCPFCFTQHVDEPDGEWTNPPHKSHLCHKCGAIWRPADVPTNGVAGILTKGSADRLPTVAAPPGDLIEREAAARFAHEIGRFLILGGITDAAASDLAVSVIVPEAGRYFNAAATPSAGECVWTALLRWKQERDRYYSDPAVTCREYGEASDALAQLVDHSTEEIK